MTLKNSKVLVLGGWGLVGSAIIHELMKYQPRSIVVTSLRKDEAEQAVQALRALYPGTADDMFVPWWGNIFTRTAWKDSARAEILGDGNTRKQMVSDIVDDLRQEMLEQQALYRLLTEHKPDAVIDCINTATAIAYQDIYSTSKSIVDLMEKDELTSAHVEHMLAGLYVPQLVRHIQIMHVSLRAAQVSMYLKVGTSGTGGMGLNIPYTHSEDKPSRVLLSKTALAGAQSMLLFLMARTPEGPIVKEVKPSAAIAWKSIEYGEIRRKGKPIELVDMKPEGAKKVSGEFRFADTEGVDSVGENLKSVYIDTGENGIFSRAEFETVSSVGQMELVTPEEIAQVVVQELRGGNTGREIVQGLDATVMGPSYRGGALRSRALEQLRMVEEQHGVSSIAFELLGPPRLTKLLYEAHLLKHVCDDTLELENYNTAELAMKMQQVVQTNTVLRQTILSVGLPILLCDGSTYLRGNEVLIPLSKGREAVTMSADNVNKWCHDGWIDLRESNARAWQLRLQTIREELAGMPANVTGSHYDHDVRYWGGFTTVDEGKLAAYLLHNEERGARIKR